MKLLPYPVLYDVIYSCIGHTQLSHMRGEKVLSFLFLGAMGLHSPLSCSCLNKVFSSGWMGDWQSVQRRRCTSVRLVWRWRQHQMSGAAVRLHTTAPSGSTPTMGLFNTPAQWQVRL